MRAKKVSSFKSLITTFSTDTPHPVKSYVFGAHPDTVSELPGLGIDSVALGNNHIFDYMTQGVVDTFAHLDAFLVRRAKERGPVDPGFIDDLRAAARAARRAGASNVAWRYLWAAYAKARRIDIDGQRRFYVMRDLSSIALRKAPAISAPS